MDTRQFQQRGVVKSYVALLQGHVAESEGVIDIPIAKDQANFPLQKICYTTGKAAQSHYRVLEYLEEHDATRVVFTPLTGRTHQLRIHSRELGHPILGCDLYANDVAFAMAERLMLHAEGLEFDHPVSGGRIKGFCPCPF